MHAHSHVDNRAIKVEPTGRVSFCTRLTAAAAKVGSMGGSIEFGVGKCAKWVLGCVAFYATSSQLSATFAPTPGAFSDSPLYNVTNTLLSNATAAIDSNQVTLADLGFTSTPIVILASLGLMSAVRMNITNRGRSTFRDKSELAKIELQRELETEFERREKDGQKALEEQKEQKTSSALVPTRSLRPIIKGDWFNPPVDPNLEAHANIMITRANARDPRTWHKMYMAHQAVNWLYGVGSAVSGYLGAYSGLVWGKATLYPDFNSSCLKGGNLRSFLMLHSMTFIYAWGNWRSNTNYNRPQARKYFTDLFLAGRWRNVPAWYYVVSFLSISFLTANVDYGNVNIKDMANTNTLCHFGLKFPELPGDIIAAILAGATFLTMMPMAWGAYLNNSKNRIGRIPLAVSVKELGISRLSNWSQLVSIAINNLALAAGMFVSVASFPKTAHWGNPNKVFGYDWIAIGAFSGFLQAITNTPMDYESYVTELERQYYLLHYNARLKKLAELGIPLHYVNAKQDAPANTVVAVASPITANSSSSTLAGEYAPVNQAESDSDPEASDIERRAEIETFAELDKLLPADFHHSTEESLVPRAESPKTKSRFNLGFFFKDNRSFSLVPVEVPLSTRSINGPGATLAAS